MGIVVSIWIVLMILTTLAGQVTNDEEWAGIQVIVLVGGVVVIGLSGLVIS